MRITTYQAQYHRQVVDLILRIQNEEAGINLSLQEQPDLLDISASYSQSGGEFWIALEEERVIGTIGLLRLNERCAALKKFFVDAQYPARRASVARSIRSFCALRTVGSSAFSF